MNMIKMDSIATLSVWEENASGTICSNIRDQISTKIATPKSISFNQVSDILIGKAPEILHTLASQLIEVSDTRNRHFWNHPDDPKEHAPDWHQFGIITHSQEVMKHAKNMRQILEEFQIDTPIIQKLDDHIDGKTKQELLVMAMMLHDIGKFQRYFITKDGKTEIKHNGHEDKWWNILRNYPDIRIYLMKELILSKEHMDYIADCVTVHYKLGNVRDAVKKRDSWFTITFAKSDECRDACDTLIMNHPSLAFEIWATYLADGLGKMGMHFFAETDAEIEQKRSKIELYIQDNHLSPKLLGGILQRPVNAMVAKTYFKQLESLDNLSK